MSINRVVVSGNLTRDPELRATPGGTQVLGFGIAVNDRRRNRQKIYRAVRGAVILLHKHRHILFHIAPAHNNHDCYINKKEYGKQKLCQSHSPVTLIKVIAAHTGENEHTKHQSAEKAVSVIKLFHIISRPASGAASILIQKTP